MSRHSFSKLLGRELTKEELYKKDYFDNKLICWDRYVVLGYDYGMDTYFLSLDSDGDCVNFSYGPFLVDIHSPYLLIMYINYLLGFSIKFDQSLIDSLIDERNSGIGTPQLISKYEKDDLVYSKKLGLSREELDEYLGEIIPAGRVVHINSEEGGE